MGWLSSALKVNTVPKPGKAMAEGGVVKAKPGGTDVTVGEEGQDEAVVPLPDTEDEPTEQDDSVDEPDPRDTALAEAQAKIELLSQVLFSMRVEGTGLLGDPSSMPYEAGMEDLDDDALTAAVLALIATDPGLGKVAPKGDIDQGSSDPPATPGVSLLNILKDAI